MSVTDFFFNNNNSDDNCVTFCDPAADNFNVEKSQIKYDSKRHISLNTQVRLMIQYKDGSTRQWENITQMQHVVELLCGAAQSSCDVFPELYNPTNKTAVYMSSTDSQKEIKPTTTTTTTTMGAKYLPVSFFWIDISNSLGGDELDVLFDHLNVNRCTRAQWKAEAAEDVLRETHTQRSFCSNPAGGEVDVFTVRSEENVGTEPDEAHIFVEEQYVHLRLAAIEKKEKNRKNNNDSNGGENKGHCVGSAAKTTAITTAGVLMEAGDDLHHYLFNADEDEDVCSIFLLCFPRGIVTWRPTPDVEGWTFISRSVKRHILRSSSSSSAREMITTSLLLRVIFDELCEVFLIDPTVFLNEVEAIDAMLPLLRQRESDQADVLRRVLLLRRRLSAHRRLLSSKLDVLEQLSRPAVRTSLSFITGSNSNNNNNGGVGMCVGDTRCPRGACFSVANRISHLLSQLDGARTILGNATILHTSSVAVRNNSDGNESEYRMISLHYVLLITLPLTIVASQWGMNCYVPWQDYDSTKPFWSIVGLMAVYAALLLAYPLYCCIIGRPDKLVF